MSATGSSAPLEREAEQIAAALYALQQPTAAKRGRHDEWPYVPVVKHLPSGPMNPNERTEQIRGVAFATRGEALEYAERVVAQRHAEFLRRLLDPRNRAEREHHGLPREIEATS